MDEPVTDVLCITPARSRYLACFILVVHLGAMAGVVASGLGAPFKVLALIFIPGAFIRVIRACWFDFERNRKYQFMLTPAGVWMRQEPGRQAEVFNAVPPVFVHPFLVVVRLVSSSSPRIRHDLILLPDNIDPVISRRLRVRLRFPP